MTNNSRWVWFLVGRVIVHALLGALTCTVVGSLLISSSGASIGWIIATNFSPRGTFGVEIIQVGAMIGAVLGGGGAALTALIAFGLIGFFSPPRRSYLPPRVVLSKVLLAMVTATVAILLSYFILMAVIGWVGHMSFSNSVSEGLPYIMFGAPLIMCVGLIAGAVWGFRANKKHAEPAA